MYTTIIEAVNAIGEILVDLLGFALGILILASPYFLIKWINKLLKGANK